MTETLLGGRYRLDEPIGRGGMAAVWRATDTVLSRPVAVKRLHAGLVADEEHRERFRREALMVARLSHPNLVHVLDRGEDGGGPYLVLELVDGEDLKSLLRREGPLAPERAARVCSQVAQALAYAHGQGLVHRDIKAQNVLLSEDGAAKLADFGIARMVGGEHEAGLTRTDMLLGSADYLSPEQANGKTLDALSDVYSLGIVLFECLTATLPYVGEGFVAVAMKHCSEPPPDPRTVLADVPEWMAEVVLRATQKDPADRYPSAAAMATALESGDAGGGTAIFRAPASPVAQPAEIYPDDDQTTAAGRPRRRRRRRRRWVAATMVTLLLLAGAAAGGLVLLGGDQEAGDGPGDEDAMALRIESVRDIDPPEGGGDGAENPDERELVVDGDAETAWFTERYQDTADFGGLKEGVGLLLRLPQPARLTTLAITSPTPGASFEVQAVADGGERPVVATGTFSGSPQIVPIETERASQSWIVWITDLVDAGDGRFHAGIAEVDLTGVPVEATG
ncbi:MAG: protein kinase [Miltoncostaeaceae bacterium]